MTASHNALIPPRFEALLQSLGADPALTNDILGDLAEEFEIRATWDGVDAARRWYRREALRTAPHLLRGWHRQLEPSGLISLVWATLAGFASTPILNVLLMRGTYWVTGIPLNAYLNHYHTTGEMMPWLLWCVLVIAATIPGTVAGLTVGLMNRRAAVPYSILLAGVVAAIETTVAAAHAPSLAMFAVSAARNVAVLAFPCVVGGFLATARRSRGPSELKLAEL